MNKKKYIFFLLILTMLFMIIFAGCGNNENQNNTPKSSGASVNISTLEVGDKVLDPTWTWEFRTDYGYTKKDGDIESNVTWIVVAKDHYETPGVVLMTENLLGYLAFDTSVLEENGLLAGQNHWGNSGTGTAKSGIRPWLNSKDIHEGEGFYMAFSENFKALVQTVPLPNKEFEKGENYVTSDNVFIPSSTELGDTEHSETYEIGHVYEYFKDSDDEMRTAFIPGDGWGERNYWLRNPSTVGYRAVGSIYEYGQFVRDFADFNDIGVRAVVCISNSTKVSKEANEDGVYTFIYN